MRYWVNTVSRDHVQRGAAGFTQAGHGKDTRLKRLSKGDRIVIESSACKVKAGDVVTKVTQKAVELMGLLYSRKLQLKKWMRDARINDLFEGTGQINRLIIARRLLGYSVAFCATKGYLIRV